MTAFAAVSFGEVGGVLARDLPAAAEREVPRTLGDTPPHEDWPGLAAAPEATDKPQEDGR